MRRALLLAVVGSSALACGRFLGLGDDDDESTDPVSLEAGTADAPVVVEGGSDPADAAGDANALDGGGAEDGASTACSGAICTVGAACCGSLVCWEPGLIGSDASRCAPCADAGEYSWGNPEYCCSKQQDDFFDCR
jgi:hypothetical protein